MKRKNYGPPPELLLAIIFAIIMIGLGIWYTVWQFNLCYPEISDNFWYCLQHAS